MTTATGRHRVTNVLVTSTLDKGAGGVQVVIRELVRHLERNGRRVDFLYPAPLSRLRLVEAMNASGQLGFDCPLPGAVGSSTLASILLFLAYLPITCFFLTRLIRRRRIDVVNCHYLAPYFIHVVIAARLAGVPVVVSVHGADVDDYAGAAWIVRFAYRLIMRAATRIVACSAALARRTVSVFPFAAAKTTYVHNGLGELNSPENRPAPHDLTTMPQPYVLSVCRHVRKKGIDTLLRAFEIVARRRPDLSLALVGDGPLRSEHMAQARALGIAERVVFVGNVAHAEVSAYFAGCLLFALPSRDEPFGIVILEAGHHNKASVCTRVGGVPEIITDGIDGVLVEPDDPDALAAAILALAGDPARREALGSRAHATVLKRFMWKDRIRDYLDIFEGRTAAERESSVRRDHSVIVRENI